MVGRCLLGCWLLLFSVTPVVAADVLFLRDPFMPVDPDTLVLNNTDIVTGIVGKNMRTVTVVGIIYDPELPYAVMMVGSKKIIAKPGDKVDSFLLERITSKSVWLKADDKTSILEVGKELTY